MNIAAPTLYDLKDFIIANPTYFNEDEKKRVSSIDEDGIISYGKKIFSQK
jgi:hypothetical protein